MDQRALNSLALLLICAVGTIVLPASKPLLVDLAYPIIKKRDAWISVFGMHILGALLGSYLRPTTGFAFGILCVVAVRVLFLEFGPGLFARRHGALVGQLVVTAGFVSISGLGYVALPQEVAISGFSQPVVAWVIACGIAILITEWAWQFLTAHRQGLLHEAMRSDLIRLMQDKEGKDAALVLLELLRRAEVGLDLRQLETLMPRRHKIEWLVRLLEKHNQVIYSTHAVLIHPDYTAKEQRLLVEELLDLGFSNKEFAAALRGVLHHWHSDRELARSDLWSLPSLALMGEDGERKGERHRARRLRERIESEMERFRSATGDREAAQDYELLLCIGSKGMTNEAAMEFLSISPGTFYRWERRAVDRLLEGLLAEDQ